MVELGETLAKQPTGIPLPNIKQEKQRGKARLINWLLVPIWWHLVLGPDDLPFLINDCTLI